LYNILNTDPLHANLQVLRFLHLNNIVHRDVKPDNFCLPYGVSASDPTPADTVYIVDMGMAQQVSSQGKASDTELCTAAAAAATLRKCTLAESQSQSKLNGVHAVEFGSKHRPINGSA
jgi:serine/threonine protein kinase